MIRFSFQILPLALFAFTCPSNGIASLEIGVGLSSATSGRVVPTLSSGIHWPSWTLSGFATGVKTPLYYHSAYQLGLYRTWSAGEWIWGDLRGGFGLAGYFAQRGYQTSDSQLDEEKDTVFGPAIRVDWSFLGPFYLSVEALYGLSHTTIHKYLNTRDMVHMSIGWRL